MNPKYPEIVEREFRKAAKLPDGDLVTVDFPEESDEIVVIVNGKRWVMEVGSDDDDFYFVYQDEKGCDYVQFDFPQDWLELEENGPWEDKS